MVVNILEKKMPKADGKEFSFLSEDHIDSSYLETFSFDSKNQYIETTTREFSAVCPFSGLPDLADVIIEYFPDGGKCVELKSLNIILSALEMLAFIKKQPLKESMKI